MSNISYFCSALNCTNEKIRKYHFSKPLYICCQQGWSSRGSSQSPSSKTGATKKKGKHFEQVKLPSKTSPGSPTSDTNAPFTRKRHHTPATIPRTRLPPGTPSTEIAAMESLRQRLSFDDNKVSCVFYSRECRVDWDYKN